MAGTVTKVIMVSANAIFRIISLFMILFFFESLRQPVVHTQETYPEQNEHHAFHDKIHIARNKTYANERAHEEHPCVHQTETFELHTGNDVEYSIYKEISIAQSSGNIFVIVFGEQAAQTDECRKKHGNKVDVFFLHHLARNSCNNKSKCDKRKDVKQ